MRVSKTFQKYKRDLTITHLLIITLRQRPLRLKFVATHHISIMHQTDSQLHFASQYLASFGIQYITKREDDSHTNLEWNPEDHTLSSRKNRSGQFLTLHVSDLALEWVTDVQRYRLDLIGHSHGEICVWLHHIALRCGLEEYDFYLHYTLDSGKLRPDHVYDDYSSERAQKLITYRNSAQEVCEAIREHFNLDTEVRVWPHHFDTGGYSTLPGSDISIGFGMAVSDAEVSDHYFYVAGYHDGQSVDTEGLGKLDHGEWNEGEFKGAILPIGGNTTDEAISFMKQSISLLAAAKQ